MKSLVQLGTVLHISNGSGNLILRTNKNVKIGTRVFDSLNNNIGSIVDVFGPINQPFLSVKLTKSLSKNRFDKLLFIKKKL
jgi:rRNA processing protein Gar1